MTKQIIPSKKMKSLIDFLNMNFTMESLYNEASKLKNNGNLLEAEKIWKLLLELSDVVPPKLLGAIYFKMGEIQKEKGETLSALSYFNKCLGLIPNHFSALKETGKLSNVMEKLQNLKKKIAVEKINIKKNENALQYSPASPSAHNNDYQYLVSAIVSTYNSEKLISDCLYDLVQQTIADKLEIIVVISGSTQNEEKVVKEFMKHYRNIFYIKTQRRETIYKAWNRGIKAARGKYITNANTDDRHRSDAYELLSAFLDEHHDVDVVFPRQYIVDDIDQSRNVLDGNGELSEVVGYLDFPEFCRDTLMEYCCVGPQPMWRATIHSDDQFYFDENLEVSGDYDFWLKISHNRNFKLFPQYLGTYFRSPQNSNKELQNKFVTMNERYLVQYRNYKLYLKSLDSWQIQNLIFNTVNQIEDLIEEFNEKNAIFCRRFEYLVWALCMQLEFSEQERLSISVALWALRLIGDSLRLVRYIRQRNLIKMSPKGKKKSEKASVSVIIHYFNNENTIFETLESLINQTVLPLEVIIIDSGSLEQSYKQLCEVIKDFNILNIQLIKVTKNHDGPCRNTGAFSAMGDYLLPIDADDQIGTTYIEKTINEFNGNPELDVVYTGTLFYGVGNGLRVQEDVSVPTIFCRNLVNVTALIKKTTFKEVGGYIEELPGYEDWELWIRFAKNKKKFKRLSEPLFFYRRNVNSRGYLSQNNDYLKRVAIMQLHKDIYRLPEPWEVPLLKQNNRYIPSFFLRKEVLTLDSKSN